MEQPTGDTSVPNQSGLDRNLADPEHKERAVRALVDDAGRATEIARGFRRNAFRRRSTRRPPNPSSTSVSGLPSAGTP
jgi:hypothetical protein